MNTFPIYDLFTIFRDLRFTNNRQLFQLNNQSYLVNRPIVNYSAASAELAPATFSASALGCALRIR